MQQGDDRGESSEFKSRSDVNQDTDDSKSEGDQRIARQLVADKFADFVILLDAKFRLRKFFLEQFLDSVACTRFATNGASAITTKALTAALMVQFVSTASLTSVPYGLIFWDANGFTSSIR